MDCGSCKLKYNILQLIVGRTIIVIHHYSYTHGLLNFDLMLVWHFCFRVGELCGMANCFMVTCLGGCHT